MKNNSWTFFLVSVDPVLNRRVRIPGILVAFAFLIVLGGTIGFARCAWFIGSYGYAKLGVHNLRIENHNLLKTVKFLTLFSKKQENKIENMISFEDNLRLKYGMNSVSSDVRRAGVGGEPDAEEMVLASLEDKEVRKASVVGEKIQSLLRQIELQDSTFSRVEQHVGRQYDHWAQIPSIWPARGRVTSVYGYRFHPILKRITFHEGFDIANKEWTPIFATADGIVQKVRMQPDFGNVVKIDHNNSGYRTVYAHMCLPAVKVGQVVKRGEIIGYMGSTGRSTGPHLHYEVIKLGRHVDPAEYLLPTDVVLD